jgi:hypothetical protein
VVTATAAKDNQVVHPPDPAPVVSIGKVIPQNPIEGQFVEIVGATTSLPTSGRIMFAEVDWGDGSGYIPVTLIHDTGEIIASHTYASAGSYTIILRVRIDLGYESSDSMPVVVRGPPTPTPTSTPTPTPTSTPSPVWDPVGSMIADQRDHTATLLDNGKVLVVGLYATHLGPDSRLTELYDPATESFSNGGDSVSSHGTSSTATLLSDGKVLIVGGNLALSSAEIYDPETNTFSPTNDLNIGRSGHTATLLPDGRVLITGGIDQFSVDAESVAAAEMFDPDTGSFSLIGNMATSRHGAAATILPSGLVLIVGGRSTEAGSAGETRRAELYDPSTESFSTTGTLKEWHSTGLRWASAPLMANGMVLIIGDLSDVAELYDPSTGEFSRIGSMNSKHFGGTATLLSSGEVLIAGGTMAQGLTEIYDPVAGTLRISESMGLPRSGHTATLLPNGDVLVIGGWVGSSTPTTNSAEIYHYR